MAEQSEIDRLRTVTGEIGSTMYTDEQLSDKIDEEGFSAAAASIWQSKAASYARMVDITEAGSSRKNSDLFKNAQVMATYWGNQTDDGDEVLPVGSYSTTRKIVRK